MLVNIDDFTMINDFYGHEIGDQSAKKTSIYLENVKQGRGC
ncbi:MAG: diguanylate cyclase [Sulfurimonas sp.]|nr:diguanylate cyclase [Sulfurimonas sp.]